MPGLSLKHVEINLNSERVPLVSHRVVPQFDEGKIDAIFAQVNQCQLPGAAVGIAIGGKPVYRKGFGLANMELPLLLSPSIRLRIGSTTKHFTCLAYMLLCEEGRVAMDDPIGKFLPDLHPVARKVTMRQLMGHTSGLRDAPDISWQFSGTGPVVTTADLVSFYRDIDDVHFPAGAGWSYNNGGYVLLSVAIERITGQSLEDVLRERIFEPVGMHDTLLRRFDTDFVPNSATMHMTTLDGRYDRSYIGSALTGEGGMVSTVDDMLRWLAHMDSPRVGSEKTWRLMKTPQTLANGVSTGYGLGLFVGHYRGARVLYHAGSVQGSNAQMLKAIDAGLDVVVMANRRDVFSGNFADKILDACLSDLSPERPVFRGPFAKGVFRSPRSGRVIELNISAADPPWTKAGQQLASIDGYDVTFEPDEQGILRASGSWESLKLTLRLEGQRESPAAIEYGEFGNLDYLVAVPRRRNCDIGAVKGCYQSSTTRTDAIISETVDGVRLHTQGRFGSAEFRLECVADGVWRAKVVDSVMPWGGILSFDNDAASFGFSAGFRTRGLVFRRSR